MTGYSGGGFLTYWWLHHRPADLLAAAPASANYWEGCRGRNPVRAPENGPKIHLFTGTLDEAGPPRIFPQSDEAVKVLRELGFEVERSHLSGRDHEMFTDLVFDFFERVRKEAAKDDGG